MEPKQYHSTNYFGAFLLIAAGIILLLNNFQVLPWSIWNTLIMFWPIVFIMIGIDAILSNNIIGNVLVSLIGLIMIALILMISISMVNKNVARYFEKRLPFLVKIERLIERKQKKNLDLDLFRFKDEFEQEFDSQEKSVTI